MLNDSSVGRVRRKYSYEKEFQIFHLIYPVYKSVFPKISDLHHDTVVKILNEKNILDFDDQPFTIERVTSFFRKHRDEIKNKLREELSDSVALEKIKSPKIEPSQSLSRDFMLEILHMRSLSDQSKVNLIINYLSSHD